MFCSSYFAFKNIQLILLLVSSRVTFSQQFCRWRYFSFYWFGKREFGNFTNGISVIGNPARPPIVARYLEVLCRIIAAKSTSSEFIYGTRTAEFLGERIPSVQSSVQSKSTVLKVKTTADEWIARTRNLKSVAVSERARCNWWKTCRD